ncbi:uncharacterized protein LOC101856472 isoform X4 [Aplysia californica]|uniref:Uncharacterized protein LOC101856472 isoform X4 n=1 Tax=Aplysia californica TaxID=6500 RepID=A0ABM1W224_APLCA|nr:uncharacterized protein LOC101856472 isoform X4 [Aplysia californica]
MSSQFDDLLADFGDSSSATSGSGLKASSNGTADDFDPLGPSLDSQTPASTDTNGGDPGLLLDFSVDTEVKNGDASNEVNLEFQADSSVDNTSANPLYEMSADTQSSNPLYDFSSSSGNPLYDLTTEESNSSQSANPLYDFSAETTDNQTAESSGNPLYDFENGHAEPSSTQQETEVVGSGGNAMEDDFFGTITTTTTTTTSSSDADLLGDFGDQNQAVTESFEEQQPEEQQEDVIADQSSLGTEDQQDSFFREEIVQQEEIVQDGRTISKTTRTENQFSDGGLENSNITSESYTSDQWADRNSQNADYNNRGAEEQDIVHFSEMSSVKSRFEGEPEPPPRAQVDIQQEVLSAEGGVYESEPQAFTQWQNEEEEEEGVHESVPVRRDDVAREADKDMTADLPAVGTASSIRAKFLSGQVENSNEPRNRREITPPAHGTGGEFVSEPRTVVEKYEGKAEAGVFESEPQANPEVVTSYSAQEEVLPEQGFARNVAARFKDLEKNQSTPSSSGKREITPDRSGQVEYVSEPRGQVEHYEGKADSGVFESEPQYNPDVVRSGEDLEEQLPERGMARNIASKFRQISTDNSQYSSPRGKREITPDRSGRVEYVSEPRGHVEQYEARVDAGVFENQPAEDPNVVKSDTSVSQSEADDYVPERGFARNVAAKFRELESTAKSPPLSPGRRKEFTPPREDAGARQSGVYESTPEVKAEVVHSGDMQEEALPERGTARNMAQRFRQMESESRTPGSPRAKKEFTPPPAESGVFESQPQQFQADYNRPPESGIIENQPVERDDVVRGSEPPKHEEELPERGFARNLVSRWKQMESQSAQATSPGSAGRVKEFTPPREEPRIAQQRKSPRTPMSPTGQMDNGSVHPSELPGQYQPQNEPSVFESQPEHLPDVVREEDTDWAEGMPKKDTAKKMLARFQQIQAEAKKEQPKPVSRKEPGARTQRKESESESSEPPEPPMENARLKFEDPEKVGRSKSMRAAIQTEKCGACEKTVYAMERLEMNKRVYHKACFRCSQCKAVLTPKTFAINNDVIFCTTHYKQLFATKGNYDEGFGRMQHKKRWNSHPNLAEGEGDGSQEAKS